MKYFLIFLALSVCVGGRKSAECFPINVVKVVVVNVVFFTDVMCEFACMVIFISTHKRLFYKSIGYCASLMRGGRKVGSCWI